MATVNVHHPQEEPFRSLSARNSRTPLGSLPNEIVIEIMLIVRDESERYQWIRIIHIFRSWRAIALQTPMLWSILHIPPLDVTSQQELLRRAQDIPLKLVNLSLKTSSSWAIPDNRAALRHYFATGIIRTRKFVATITADEQSKEGPLQAAVQADAPLLQHLSLEGKLSPLLIPNRIFRGNMPSLRHLSLSSCRFTWDSLPLQCDLLSLAIYSPTLSPTWEQLQYVLGRMSHLERLRLCQAFPTTLTDTLDLLCFPNLQYLELNGHTVCISTLLAHLSFPPSASITLQTYDRGNAHVSLLKSLNSFYAKHPPHSIPQPPDEMDFVHGEWMLRIKLGSKDKNWFGLFLTHPQRRYDATADDLIFSLMQLLPLMGVRRMRIRTYLNLQSRVRALCPNAEEIEYVDVSESQLLRD
ncbi:hypothetical protein AX16_009483 [Volvariella volvacea WC 439]|nr:hypothetical protein AX16_009483 [Volvariella volvacea WC 439]